MGAKRGLKGSVWINNGAYDTPDWEECDRIQDLNVDGDEWEMADATVKGDGDVISEIKTMRKLEYSFNLIHDEDYDHVIALQEAFADPDASVDLLVLPPDVTPTTPGARGVRAPFVVKKFKQPQMMKGVFLSEVAVAKTYGRAAEIFQVAS